MLDFSAFITDRTRDFTGHERVFATIDHWLADPDLTEEWCRRALDALGEAYPLVQRDSAFPPGYAEQRIRPHIYQLEGKCGRDPG